MGVLRRDKSRRLSWRFDLAVEQAFEEISTYFRNIED